MGHPLPHAGPELLDGVQARGIGREEEQLHLPAQASHKVASAPRTVRGAVIEDHNQVVVGIQPREGDQEALEVLGVYPGDEHEVLRVPRGIEHPVHVRMILAGAHLDLGPFAFTPPHARDRGLPLHGARVHEDEPLPRPRVLDSLPELVKAPLLLGRVPLRGHLAGAHEGQPLLPEHPRQRAGGDDLAEGQPDVMAGQARRPVREVIPESVRVGEHSLGHLLLLLGGQEGRPAGTFFLYRPARPSALNASTQRRTVSGDASRSSATCSALPSLCISIMALSRRTRSPSCSFL